MLQKCVITAVPVLYKMETMEDIEKHKQMMIDEGYEVTQFSETSPGIVSAIYQRESENVLTTIARDLESHVPSMRGDCSET